MPVNSTAITRFLEILPDNVRDTSLATMTGARTDLVVLQRTLAEVEWSKHRPVVEDLLRAVLPIENLVPGTYEKWRPVVRDGFSFIGAAACSRAACSQTGRATCTPLNTPVTERLMAFIRRIPSLQKIAQSLARNQNLDADFRLRLAELEDDIRDVSESEIRAEIEHQLGDAIRNNNVRLELGLYAEGSVSAVVRFTCESSREGVPSTGVFKVLKPFITKCFEEDLTLLGELADYFDANQATYDLDNLSLRAILDNVRDLFVRETDFVNERVSLAAAARRYATTAGVRVPAPIESLSTSTITAMTEEQSVKVTDAYPDDAQRRCEIARRLIECLVAQPLFSPEAPSPFHADPHAGNLRINELAGDIVLLDWALTDSLTIEDRRQLIMLFLAIPLRDEGRMQDALFELSQSKTENTRNLLREQIEAFVDSLPLGTIPGPGSLSSLVGRLLRAGGRFSSSFLVFRKMLATLGDIVEQLCPGVSIERGVAEYALAQGLRNAFLSQGGKPGFQIPLNASDLLSLGFGRRRSSPGQWPKGCEAFSGHCSRGDRKAN